MDKMQLISIDTAEDKLNKYIAILRMYIISKRFDESKNTYSITGEFDLTTRELNSILKKAERDGVFITLQRNGQTFSNNLRKCYLYSCFFSVIIPLFIALLLTAVSFFMAHNNIVPQYVSSAFTLAIFFQFIFVNLIEILAKKEKVELISGIKK